jgi:hypothetical protein
MHSKFWLDDGFAAERSLAGSAAVTGERSLRQLLKKEGEWGDAGRRAGSQGSDCPV